MYHALDTMTAMLAITAILSFGYGTLLYQYHRGFRKALHQISYPQIEIPSATIIVTARNEEVNIAHCLQSLLTQQYPGELEILVVDDHSTDRTAEIARNLGIRVIDLSTDDLPNTIAFKKHAITAGIREAKGEIILTTDADCTLTPHWAKILTSTLLQNHAVMVTGPVFMVPENSFLSRFQTMDFAVLQGIGMASVSAGMHSMSSGASLAYRRDAFLQINGFEGVNDIASGDDMLLMEKMQTAFPGKITVAIDSNAIVRTQTEKTWQDFFSQRIRWASKATRYQDPHIKFSLAWVYVFNLVMLLQFFMGLFNPTYLASFVISLTLKTLVEWRFVQTIFRFFGCTGLMSYFVYAQPIHVVYTVISGTFGLWGRSTWKGRKIK